MSPLTDPQKALVEQHVPLAYKTASRIARRLQPQLTWDEALGPCFDGLIKAAQKYNPDLGCSFITYAEKQMNWHVADYLREIHRFSRAMQIAIKTGTAKAPRHHPLDEIMFRTRDGEPMPTFAETIEDFRCGDPAAHAVAAERFSPEATRCLSDLERRVLTGYFRDHKTMQAIGREENLSESRISQMVSQMLHKLRASSEYAVA